MKYGRNFKNIKTKKEFFIELHKRYQSDKEKRKTYIERQLEHSTIDKAVNNFIYNTQGEFGALNSGELTVLAMEFGFEIDERNKVTEEYRYMIIKELQEKGGV